MYLKAAVTLFIIAVPISSRILLPLAPHLYGGLPPRLLESQVNKGKRHTLSITTTGPTTTTNLPSTRKAAPSANLVEPKQLHRQVPNSKRNGSRIMGYYPHISSSRVAELERQSMDLINASGANRPYVSFGRLGNRVIPPPLPNMLNSNVLANHSRTLMGYYPHASSSVIEKLPAVDLNYASGFQRQAVYSRLLAALKQVSANSPLVSVLEPQAPVPSLNSENQRDVPLLPALRMQSDLQRPPPPIVHALGQQAAQFPLMSAMRQPPPLQSPVMNGFRPKIPQMPLMNAMRVPLAPPQQLTGLYNYPMNGGQAFLGNRNAGRNTNNDYAGPNSGTAFKSPAHRGSRKKDKRRQGKHHHRALHDKQSNRDYHRQKVLKRMRHRLRHRVPSRSFPESWAQPAPYNSDALQYRAVPMMSSDSRPSAFHSPTGMLSHLPPFLGVGTAEAQQIPVVDSENLDFTAFSDNNEKDSKDAQTSEANDDAEMNDSEETIAALSEILAQLNDKTESSQGDANGDDTLLNISLEGGVQRSDAVAILNEMLDHLNRSKDQSLSTNSEDPVFPNTYAAQLEYNTGISVADLKEDGADSHIAGIQLYNVDQRNWEVQPLLFTVPPRRERSQERLGLSPMFQERGFQGSQNEADRQIAWLQSQIAALNFPEFQKLNEISSKIEFQPFYIDPKLERNFQPYAAIPQTAGILEKVPTAIMPELQIVSQGTTTGMPATATNTKLCPDIPCPKWCKLNVVDITICPSCVCESLSTCPPLQCEEGCELSALPSKPCPECLCKYACPTVQCPHGCKFTLALPNPCPVCSCPNPGLQLASYRLDSRFQPLPLISSDSISDRNCPAISCREGCQLILSSPNSCPQCNCKNIFDTNLCPDVHCREGCEPEIKPPNPCPACNCQKKCPNVQCHPGCQAVTTHPNACPTCKCAAPFSVETSEAVKSASEKCPEKCSAVKCPDTCQLILTDPNKCPVCACNRNKVPCNKPMCGGYSKITKGNDGCNVCMCDAVCCLLTCIINISKDCSGIAHTCPCCFGDKPAVVTGSPPKLEDSFPLHDRHVVTSSPPSLEDSFPLHDMLFPPPW